MWSVWHVSVFGRRHRPVRRHGGTGVTDQTVLVAAPAACGGTRPLDPRQRNYCAAILATCDLNLLVTAVGMPATVILKQVNDDGRRQILTI